MKSITKHLITYERVNLYDDQTEKRSCKLSYTEIDDNGNIVLDQSFNQEDGSSNTIIRSFDDKNQVTEERFIDGDEQEPYEIRRYRYLENGKTESCEVHYQEDTITEKYTYSENGDLLTKEIFYEDGSSYTDTECTWENGRLIEEKEFSDTDELQTRKEYTYDEDGRPVKVVLYEPEADMSVVNKTTEELTYGPYGIICQETYNISDHLVVRRSFSYDEQGRRTSVVIESASSYFKHLYGYDEKGNCVLDQMLNKDNIILNEKRTSFNENGEETSIHVYSKNIVDNTDELMLIESYITEYQYI